MSTEKVLLGVVAGAALGAIFGVLFAPEKGSDTRKKIYKKGEENAEAMKDKFNEFIDGINEKFEKVKEEVTDFAENGKAKFEEEVKTAKK